jgi:phosphoesterase RecJ-like protein
MELTPKQQTVELLRASKRILLLTRPQPNGDAIGSVCALALTLMKRGKEVALVCPDPVPKALQFLPATSGIKQEIPGSVELVITVSPNHKVEKVAYRRRDDGALEVVLTPKGDPIPKDALEILEGKPSFDAVVVLDTTDLEFLSRIFNTDAKIFLETPVINIDHQPGNDYFGKINWVDLSATSTSEMLVSLIEALAEDEPLFDKDIATCLLAGILSDTNSFQSESTTPKSLTVAAQMIALGASKDDIVKYLFKTRSYSTLKVWGHILSNLVEEKEARLIWAEVPTSTLEETEAEVSDIPQVLDEFLKNAPETELAVVFVAHDEGVTTYVRALKPQVDTRALALQLKAQSSGPTISLNVADRALSDVKDATLAEIRAFQAKALAPK